jgi:chromate transporter
MIAADAGERHNPERSSGGASCFEVFRAFLRLGLTSFGGPVAHLGYFHRDLVARRHWIDEAHYAQLVALCQFLPGPASSQLGFALGVIRAGWCGGLAAFTAFTLPSALLLFALATQMTRLAAPSGQAMIHGLKLLAVAVVAQGVVSMSRALAADWTRASIAVAAAVLALVGGSAWIQLVIVGAGALLGLAFCRNVRVSPALTFGVRYGRRTGLALLTVFSLLLAVAIELADSTAQLGSVAGAFYRSGALVFGGGHVVLPLLQQAVVTPGWIDRQDFLAGYGAAQAVPGPMFSVAAYLGASFHGGRGGPMGAIVGVIALFLPGLLLVAGVLPFWRSLAQRITAVRALAGVNAAVVGLLAAALYTPVWTSAVLGPIDLFIALVAFVLLSATRSTVLVVLGWCVLASLAACALGARPS